MRIPRFKAAIATAAVALLALTACAQSERTEDDGDDTQLIFGTAGEALTLDPTFASDGETFRVARQIYDTLVMLAPGTADIVPGLAETYESDESGTMWTFNLREGVTFHDGTDFNAEAVCINFDRWYNLEGVAQDPSMAYYWQSMAGGFANNAPDRDDLGESLYASCDATEELTAVVQLSKPSSKFPSLLVLPAFGMHSPTALEQFDANNVSGTADEPTWPEYALDHPTGTGPFKFEPGSWDRANLTITLVRNDDYWGEAATISRLIFQAIPNETARRQALLSGDIDGYDLPSPADWTALENAGMSLHIRDSFNLLYIAFTENSNPELEKPDVRRAIAHALNRQAMVDALLPDGAEVASQFQPPILAGWNPDVPTYDYNPDLARELLADAGAEDLTIDFYWPTDVTRPYMPDPQSIFELFRADLEAVGITVNEVSLPWSPQYLADVQDGAADLHFLGWTGDYPDAYNFIGTWFARALPQWGFQNQALFDLMAEADGTADADERTVLYQELNAMIMEALPGVPISHTPPGIVFAPYVSGVAISPLTDERFFSAVVDR
jgi:peptide/nickel transport system substrate-binding protein